MWRAVARFELRQQLRSPVFAVVVGLTALLVLGSATVARLQVGPLADGLRNGSEAVLRTYGVWSLFFAFTAVAFAGEAVLRDEQTRFGPVLRSTGVGRGAVYWGRFLGAFATTAAAYLAVPLGMLAAPSAPWAEAGTMGPVPWRAHALAFFGVGLPNLFLLCAVVFALCTVTRSLAGGWLGAVGLLIAYGLGSEGGAGAPPPLLEPFGFAAVERSGLLVNRLLWMGVGVAALFAASRSPSPEEGRGGRAAVRVGVSALSPDVDERPSQPHPSGAARRPPSPFGEGEVRAALAQLSARTRWEMRAVFGAPFWVVLGLGAINAGSALWAAAEGGAETTALIGRLIEAFRLVPTVIALFYAGELVWAERDARTHDLIGATPAPDWAFLIPKLLALGGVLLGLLAVSAGVGWTVDLTRGTPGADGAAWLQLYVLPRSFDWLAFGVLAVFLQTVSPSKLAGWGWTVLYLVSAITLENLGLHNGLYRYGGRLDGPLSDLLARDGARGAWLRLYWAAFALLLAVLAYALVGRGLEPRWRGRLAQARRRLAGVPGALAGAAVAVFVGAGLVLAAA